MQISKTFSIHFWTHLAKRKGDLAPVYARVTVDQKRVEISLKKNTEVTFWNPEIKRSASKNPQAKTLNRYLDEVYNDLLECYQALNKELLRI